MRCIRARPRGYANLQKAQKVATVRDPFRVVLIAFPILSGRLGAIAEHIGEL